MIFFSVAEEYRDLIPEKVLIQAAETTLLQLQLEQLPSLTIKITGNEEIRVLNSAYRGVDKATDVLSFSADYYDPDLETHYSGDIVISYPQAAEQADKRGHSVISELQLLVIHGVLHLLGYDHGTAVEKRSMWSLQQQVLDALGLDILVEDDESN